MKTEGDNKVVEEVSALKRIAAFHQEKTKTLPAPPDEKRFENTYLFLFRKPNLNYVLLSENYHYASYWASYHYGLNPRGPCWVFRDDVGYLDPSIFGRKIVGAPIVGQSFGTNSRTVIKILEDEVNKLLHFSMDDMNADHRAFVEKFGNHYPAANILPK